MPAIVESVIHRSYGIFNIVDGGLDVSRAQRVRMDEKTHRIGIVGLGTSHSEQFANILIEHPQATVAGVWHADDVRSESYVVEFCGTYGADKYERLEDMADGVDAAMVLTVDWDRHLPLARTFLYAGVPVFVDKPLAGSVADVNALWSVVHETGTPLFGGSAVSFHPSIDTMRMDGGPHDLFIAGYNGPFYYGAHLTHTARRICGTDWEVVEPTPHHHSARVTFADGSSATLRFDGPTRDPAFGILDVGSTIRTARIESTQVELQRMYEPFIDTFLKTVQNGHDESDCLCDASTLLLAVQAAIEHDHQITPSSVALEEVTEEGRSFVDEYEPLY